MDILFRVLYGLGIVAVGVLLTKLGRIISHFFRGKSGNGRVETIRTLVFSLYVYAVVFVAIYLILKLSFGFSATTLLAALGVGGLIIGLGAQSFIKDALTGFFIIVENQFAVGDLITVKGVKGTVKSMGLRSTKLADEDGNIYVITNSEITIVVNHANAKVKNSKR